MKLLRLTACVAATIATTVISTEERALAFGNSVCTPVTLTTAWEPNAGESSHFGLPRDGNFTNPFKVANNTVWSAYISGSAKVSTVTYNFGYAILDTNDLLVLAGSPALTFNSNVPIPFSTAPQTSTTSSSWRGSIYLQTDATTPSQGFKINTISVACKTEAPAPQPQPAYTGTKNIGFLTQAADTIYYSYPPSAKRRHDGAAVSPTRRAEF